MIFRVDWAGMKQVLDFPQNNPQNSPYYFKIQNRRDSTNNSVTPSQKIYINMNVNNDFTYCFINHL